MAGTSTSTIPESMPYCTASRSGGKSVVLCYHGLRCGDELLHVREPSFIRRAQNDRYNGVLQTYVEYDGQIAPRKVRIARLSKNEPWNRAKSLFGI